MALACGVAYDVVSQLSLEQDAQEIFSEVKAIKKTSLELEI